ncbi:MAG: hypothetical protein O2782_04695 [bacterium]|nr:hypothetical protein [bacterium]
MTRPVPFSTRLRLLSQLDARSLACLRIGTALVLAWDMVRVLRVAPDWWAMQAYGEPKLPAWLVLGSETVTLQLAAIAVLAVSLLLALGWRTGPVTIAAWISACAFQYAARATSDYHNAVLCTLLFCSLILPTATVASLDARAGRSSRIPEWLVTCGNAGLLVLLAWIYLSTAAAKTGTAWWSEGSAVWLALLDRGTPTTMGRWLALTTPPVDLARRYVADGAAGMVGASAVDLATNAYVRRHRSCAVPSVYVASAEPGQFSSDHDRRHQRSVAGIRLGPRALAARRSCRCDPAAAGHGWSMGRGADGAGPGHHAGRGTCRCLGGRR